MFSLDIKQWESVANGLLSSVAKKSSPQPATDATPEDTGTASVVDISLAKTKAKETVSR